MIQRDELVHRIRQGLRNNPVVMLVGPRQSGKTTLARQVLPGDAPNYFDMEDPVVAGLLAQPMTTLKGLRGTVVIDEAQREPGLFPVLRVLADRPGKPARFLVLGSASPELVRQASESLAGRVDIIEVRGFTTHELPDRTNALWLRGAFPRSVLARSEAESMKWRRNFMRTFLERDLGVLGFNLSPKAMGRFWSMLAHYHGQIWNASEIASSLGVSPPTAKAYLDVLEQTFMVRRLLPWYQNSGKRIVKSPKVYLRDSGILHALFGVGSMRELLVHPKLGASWEGFVIEEVLSAVEPHDAYFYNVHSGAELDLLFTRQGKRIGIEVKRQDAPRMTRSMHVALADLDLHKLFVVYPGFRRYTLDKKVECIPFAEIGSI
ncbi:MAG: ATP-binding protein [Flavobacteriales bacterium]|nr:ATP-binding protein [Flavobacteriales bacterium]